MPTTDISLEPLLNQSSEGLGSSKKVAFVPIDTAGVASSRTPLTITSTSQEVTISVGSRTIEVQNTGTSAIYYGGSDVTSTNGIKIFPNQSKVYANVKDTFSVYFVTDGADTSTLRICEYD